MRAAPTRMGSTGRKARRSVMDGAPLFTQLCVGSLWRDVGDVKQITQVCVPMPRPAARTTMKERILETTDRLFYGQGIRAVGVDTVAAEIGISKRTLYNYFPSKDELIVAYLSRHFIQAKASDRPLLEQILRYFDWLERWFASDTFRGCPFVKAAAELGDPTHPGAKMAVAFKEQRRLWLRYALTRLNVAGPPGFAT